MTGPPEVEATGAGSGDGSDHPAEDAPEGRLNPAALAVLAARLAGAAEEMSAVLRRAAFSPNIKERADCSAAVFTASGELLAQAENIPVHLGSMPASVAAVLDVMAADGARPRAGEHWIVNDPFAGGTHLNDVTVVTPCLLADRLVGWAANRAHHADLGGSAPGSMPADATEVFAEGLRLPPVRLTPEVRAVVAANTRTPAERAGDLDAQVGANERGVERLAEVLTDLLADAGGHVGRSGGNDGRFDLLDELLEEVLAYGERLMRAALATLADGTWHFSDVIDSVGAGHEQQSPSVIDVALTIEGSEVTVDLTGSSPQRPGTVNAPASVTTSAVVYALRASIGPDLPANGGCLRPVRVVTTPATIVDAVAPVAVGAGNVEVSQRVADACFGALVQVRPDLVGAASQGTMNNLLVGGLDDANRPWVYYETIGGGQGGRPFRPGARRGTGGPEGDPAVAGVGMAGQSGIHTCMTNTRNTPIEALERTFPLRVVRQRLRRGSGGAGSAPGGEGIERDLQVLVDATASLITERRVSQPWGLAGGDPGAVGENWLLPGGDESRAERLPDKCTVHLRAGDVLRMLTPGGGGWGPPSDPRRTTTGIHR